MSEATVAYQVHVRRRLEHQRRRECTIADKNHSHSQTSADDNSQVNS